VRAAWLVIGLAIAATAQAADEDPHAYYERARAQFALGKYADAAINFEKVFELSPDPAILYNAAQAHRLAGNKQRALELYTSYLRIYGEHVDNRAEVQRHIDGLRVALEKERQVVNQQPMTTKPPPERSAVAPPRVAPPPKVEPPKAVLPERSAAEQPRVAPPPKVEPPNALPPVTPPPAAPTATKPTVVATPAVEERPRERRPVRPWVWGVVGGVAAVVVAGVIVGVAIGTSTETNPKPSFGSIRGN
jgi:hypothetical protein